MDKAPNTPDAFGVPGSQILLFLVTVPQSRVLTTSDLFTVSTTSHFLECHRILWPVHLFLLSGANMPLYQHFNLFTHAPTHGLMIAYSFG